MNKRTPVGLRALTRTLLALASVASGRTLATAAPMVDQQHVLTQSVGGSVTFRQFEVGQTFTVGQGGLLTQVDLGIGKIGSPTDDLLLDVRRVTQGVPSDDLPLFQTVVPLSAIPPRAGDGLTPLTPVDVSAGGILVSPGEELSVVISSNQEEHSLENSVVWDRGQPGYAGGAAGERFGTSAWTLDPNPYDFGFRTWVDPTPVLPGDFNGDLKVDAADYAVWRQTYGSTVDLRADGNGDLKVDAADYTVWRDNLTTPSASAASAPEPGGVVLMGVLLAIPLFHRGFLVR